MGGGTQNILYLIYYLYSVSCLSDLVSFVGYLSLILTIIRTEVGLLNGLTVPRCCLTEIELWFRNLFDRIKDD